MFKPPAISLLHPFHDPLASWHYLPKASSASNEEATQDLGAVPNTLGEEVGRQHPVRQHALENVANDLERLALSMRRMDGGSRPELAGDVRNLLVVAQLQADEAEQPGVRRT
jgi:hypothetical protein